MAIDRGGRFAGKTAGCGSVNSRHARAGGGSLREIADPQEPGSAPVSLSASGFLGLSLMMHTERTALFGESATDQRLHYTDLIYKLWNESWAKVDVGTREEFRNQGIQNELNRQGGKEPSK